MNLIDIERAKRNIQSITDNTQDALLGVLVAAVSDAAVKYCRRDFAVRAYDELYNGTGDRRLLLRQYPVQTVDSVRYRPVTVLKVTNNTPANVQARVTCTSTCLTLVRVNAGVKSTDTSVTWSANPTLTAVANAVNALGNGWSAQVVGDATNYGSWPSVDLYWPPAFGDGVAGQGALQCAGGSFAELKMHTYELQGFQWDARGWLLRAIPYTDPELLHPEDLVWPTGINNFRIQYTAGYTTVPEAVQEACAEWVAELYFLTLRDPAASRISQQQTASTTLGKFTSSQQERVATHPSDYVARLLAPYRRHTVMTNQG
jgi:hypothetical protein